MSQIEVMKAITIWQPWASLIACGAKRFETRSWATKYRGPIAIHAAAKSPYETLISLSTNEMIAMARALRLSTGAYMTADLSSLPRGCIIATAELVNCWRIVYNPGPDVDKAMKIPIGGELEGLNKHHPDFGKFIVPTEQEMLFGDWTPERYAWELANVQMLPEPIPAKGKQGLWNWERVA